MTTPYDKALDHIKQHPGTGSATALAKLILSLFNGDECPFSYRECITPLDSERTRLALDMVEYFTLHGEDADLVRVGHEVCKRMPDLWELGEAMHLAKCEFRTKRGV